MMGGRGIDFGGQAIENIEAIGGGDEKIIRCRLIKIIITPLGGFGNKHEIVLCEHWYHVQTCKYSNYQYPRK